MIRQQEEERELNKPAFITIVILAVGTLIGILATRKGK